MIATDAEHARLRPNHKQGASGVDTFCVECVAEMEAALRLCEWASEGACPVCDEILPDGHDADCPVGLALEGSG